jgi:cytoskeletal protein RodZ
MDVLTFISDQVMYLLSVALPDANPKQIQLLLLSAVGLVIVLMMFAIMWSMFSEKPEPQRPTPKDDEVSEADAPVKAKASPKSKKTSKTAKKPATEAAKKAPKKAASKKAGTKKVVAKKKTEPKIEPLIEANDDMSADDANDMESPLPESTAGGFSFFKRESADAKADAALISIEQEMLAIRQLYMDERITKDVYVVETRRLYE